MKKSFLTAEWRKLLIFNYTIDPEILKKYIPKGTELDLFEGKCYVSLIGFLFLNTRLLGFKIPYHSNFEEVNLRFYVKYLENNEWKRGAVFIKELVPKAALSFVANTVYNEHYETVKMDHSWKIDEQQLNIHYSFKFSDKMHSLQAIAENRLIEIPIGSEAEFITEHYWGYTKYSEKKTFEYGVTHPRWEMYPIISSEVKLDFENVYGDDFSILNQLEPVSVFLAEGSNITVEKKRTISNH